MHAARFVAPVLMVILAACGSRDVRRFSGSKEQCPVYFHFTRTQFQSAISFAVEMQSRDRAVESIYIELPFSRGLQVRPAAPSARAPTRNNVDAHEGWSPQRLSHGLLDAAWDLVSTEDETGTIHIPPGRYRIYLRYRVDARANATTCETVSPEFELLRDSQWTIER